MALNDNDKEFIKKTVDDAISKSEKTNQQKMSDAIKSNEEKQEKQSKKDRQATLEYLDKVGVLTLAEKMELFKNNISKEIKQTAVFKANTAVFHCHYTKYLSENSGVYLINQ